VFRIEILIIKLINGLNFAVQSGKRENHSVLSRGFLSAFHGFEIVKTTAAAHQNNVSGREITK